MFVLIFGTLLVVAMLITKRNILMIFPGFGIFPRKEEYPLWYWSTIITAVIAMIAYALLEYGEGY
jgi:membrane protein DedA with SNARE-associated domain